MIHPTYDCANQKTCPAVATTGRPRTAKFLGGIALLSFMIASPATAQIPNTDVNATYDIRLNGINLGSFSFTSKIRGGRYKMSSRAHISILGGLVYSWEGVGNVNGTVSRGKPKANNYSFKFRDSKKSGIIRMSYAGGEIQKLSVLPRKGKNPLKIPVTRSHMNTAYDPLSALLALVKRGRGHRAACANRIPVFDGKVRFDLALSYKKVKRISSYQSGGYEGPLIVCKVKYIPIAGHKPGSKQTRHMQRNNGIEVWLMPLPKSRLYVPYQIVIPTQVGTAVAISTRFELKSRGGRKVALVR